MANTKSFSSKNRPVKNLLCMNSDPENSKWGEYAPPGGCDEIVKNVDESVTKTLCWRCTMRATDGRKTYP